MAQTLTPKKLERCLGDVRFETESLRRLVERQRELLIERKRRRRGVADEAVEALCEVEQALGRILDVLPSSVGLSVEQAAERLEVSPPTVRKWLELGLLKRVDGRKPIKVSDESVAALQEVFSRVRAAFPERAWTAALAAYLHDRALLSSGWVQRGLEDAKAGRVVTLAE